MKQHDEDFRVECARQKPRLLVWDRRGRALPMYHTTHAVGFDIAVLHDVLIPPGQVVTLETGLIVKPPEGYWVMIAARSSTQKRNLMLAGNVGIIDPDFCGPDDELSLPMLNFGSVSVLVEAGTRLAQGILVPLTQGEIVAFEPSGESRGGFGSTGAK